MNGAEADIVVWYCGIYICQECQWNSLDSCCKFDGATSDFFAFIAVDLCTTKFRRHTPRAGIDGSNKLHRAVNTVFLAARKSRMLKILAFDEYSSTAVLILLLDIWGYKERLAL
jgi:hypothetical protein